MNIRKITLQLFLSIVACAAILSGCTESEPRIYQVSGPVMGTTYHVKFRLPDPFQDGDLANLKDEVHRAMQSVDDEMSTYKPDSPLSKFNQYPENQWFNVSEDLLHVIDQAKHLSESSGGLYDVTVGPLVNLWGFGPTPQPDHIPEATEIELAKQRVGYQYLDIDIPNKRIRKRRPVYVDLSSIAKGYAVDKVADALDTFGIHDYLVEIGGEIRASGEKYTNTPWILAIEAPTSETRSVFKKISVRNKAVATSGDYRNYYEENGIRYSHTINPLTGRPIEHKLASVTVVHDQCAMADAMATMFMVMGPELAYDYAVKEKIPVYLIYRSGKKFETRFSPEFEPFFVE